MPGFPMPSSSAPLCFRSWYWLPTAFSPPLSDIHSQSTIITMRTSAVVTFICLAMGIGPSFSSSITSFGLLFCCRANLSKRSQPPYNQGSSPRNPPLSHDDSSHDGNLFFGLFKPVIDAAKESRNHPNTSGNENANGVHLNGNVNGRGTSSPTPTAPEAERRANQGSGPSRTPGNVPREGRDPGTTHTGG
ncbi:hypothetical protein F5148DRAFT_1207548 [Russula earlei]|uniref:Uncharacterized protein n=1 Tax=Russula earlei TaxID=71964 RepID=A0ACC0U694_9AGAM|nr:hypothetical protein F5148DRAFT_1207548 [Russula earlei]